MEADGADQLRWTSNSPAGRQLDSKLDVRNESQKPTALPTHIHYTFFSLMLHKDAIRMIAFRRLSAALARKNGSCASARKAEEIIHATAYLLGSFTFLVLGFFFSRFCRLWLRITMRAQSLFWNALSLYSGTRCLLPNWSVCSYTAVFEISD
jgi:hypothetical protein